MSPSPLEIRPHPTKGRGLYATKSFSPGAVILPFTPLVLLPTVSYLASVCSYCFRPGNPRACSRCHAASYCDATCQAAAWKAVHARECKALRQGIKDESRRRMLPTPTKALMQALLCREIGDGLKDLEGLVLERKAAGGDEWKDIEMMAMAACAFSGLGTAEGDVRRAAEMLCKVGCERASLRTMVIVLIRIARFKTIPFSDLILIWASLACFWSRRWPWRITLAFPMLRFSSSGATPFSLPRIRFERARRWKLLTLVSITHDFD